MRKVFTGLSMLLMVLVVLQFFLAASGAFDTAPKDESFGPHESLGHLILLYAVLLTVLAAPARMPGRVIAKTGLVVALAILQPVIAGMAGAFDDTANSTTAGELVFGLHAVNGLAIMALSWMIVRDARRFARSASPGAPTGTGDEVNVPGPAA